MEYECSICLQELFSVNNDVSVTTCGHMFHKSCFETSIQVNPECAICKTYITYYVDKIHPDVDDELVYNSSAHETEAFLEKMYDLEREKRTVMLNIIKKLDKENIASKATNKSFHQDYKACEVFLTIFEKEKSKLQEKCQNLEVENKTILAEIRELNEEKELDDVFEDSDFECGIEIEKDTCDDSRSDIEALLDKGLLIFY